MGEPVARGTVSGLGPDGPGHAPARCRRPPARGPPGSCISRASRCGVGSTLRGDARVPFDGRPLTGHAQGRLEDLGAWAALLPPAWAPSGPLAFEASLAGTLDRPEGEATIEGSGIDPPRAAHAGARPRAAAAHCRCDGDPRGACPSSRRAGRLLASGHFDPGMRSSRCPGHRGGLRASSPGLPGRRRSRASRCAGRLSGQGSTWGCGRRASGRRPLRASRPLVGPAVPGGRRPSSWRATGRRPTASPPSCASTAPTSRRSHELPAQTTTKVSGTASLAARLRSDVTAPTEGTWELDLDRLEGRGVRPAGAPARARAPADREGSHLARGPPGGPGGRPAGGGGHPRRLGRERAATRVARPARGPVAPPGGDGTTRARPAPRLVGEGDLALVLRGTPDNPRPEGTLRVTGGGMTRGDEPLVQSTRARGFVPRRDSSPGGPGGGRPGLPADPHRRGRQPVSSPLLAPEPLRRSLGGDARARAHLSIVRADEASSGTKGEPLRVEADLETDALSLERVRAKAR